MSKLNIIETNITHGAAQRLLKAVEYYAQTDYLDIHLTVEQRDTMTKSDKVLYLRSKNKLLVDKLEGTGGF